MSKKGVLPTLSGVKLRLSIKDRLLIAQFFPEKGNLLSQIICEDIEQKTRLSQNEMIMIGFKDRKTPDGRILGWTWDEKKEREVEILFTKAEIEFIKKQVERLDQENQITRDLLSLCRKIKELNPEKQSDNS